MTVRWSRSEGASVEIRRSAGSPGAGGRRESASDGAATSIGSAPKATTQPTATASLLTTIVERGIGLASR